MRRIEIKTDSIKLDSFLKWAGVVETGGQAKFYVAEGKIQVNGEKEIRRGRQLFPGDIVSIEGFGEYTIEGGRRD